MSDTVKSVEKTLELLNLLAEAGRPLGVSELAQQAVLPKATVHRILQTLLAYSYLQQQPETGKYSLSWACLKLSKSYLQQMDYRQAALPHMREIQQELNQSVNLFVSNGVRRICVERIPSSRPLRQVMRIGDEFPLDKGAAGKLFMAYTAAEESLTPEQLKIRKQGYVITQGDRVADAASVAVPLLGYQGRLVAVLSISGPIGEYTEQQLPVYLDCLVRHGRAISQKIGQ